MWFLLRSADRKQKANTSVSGLCSISWCRLLHFFDILYLISQGLAYKPETAHCLSNGGFVSEVIDVSVVMWILGRTLEREGRGLGCGVCLRDLVVECFILLGKKEYLQNVCNDTHAPENKMIFTINLHVTILKVTYLVWSYLTSKTKINTTFNSFTILIYISSIAFT